MKEQILKISKDLAQNLISETEAQNLLLNLFDVSGRSKQLVCDKCIDGLSKSKSFKKGTCVHCRKEIEQTNSH
jgi:hypothetical protein